MSKERRRFNPGVLLTFISLLLVPFFVLSGETLRDALTARVVNVLASLLVGLSGIVILRMIWSLEHAPSKGGIRFAWSYFAIQHAVFGFGGLLVSVFDRGYLYANDQGTFV